MYDLERQASHGNGATPDHAPEYYLRIHPDVSIRAHPRSLQNHVEFYISDGNRALGPSE